MFLKGHCVLDSRSPLSPGTDPAGMNGICNPQSLIEVIYLVFGNMTLFHTDHLPDQEISTSPQLVEIYAAGHSLT